MGRKPYLTNFANFSIMRVRLPQAHINTISYCIILRTAVCVGSCYKAFVAKELQAPLEVRW